jgi:hypothetical protein
MSEFMERRSPNHIEMAVFKLSTELGAFKDIVKTDLNDYGKRLEGYMEHSDAMQRQMQESLQRQLDQNNEQHKEIVAIFKETIEDNKQTLRSQIEGFTHAAEIRIDAIVESQRLEDIDRNQRLSKHDELITELQQRPDKKIANSVRTVLGYICLSVITVAVTLCGTWLYDSTKSQPKQNTQIEVTNK